MAASAVRRQQRQFELERLQRATVKRLNPPPSAVETTNQVVWQAILEAADIAAQDAFESMEKAVAS